MVKDEAGVEACEAVVKVDGGEVGRLLRGGGGGLIQHKCRQGKE